jgi:tripartite-type tricarboxylate transporter receptor subunit TctC
MKRRLLVTFRALAAICAVAFLLAPAAGRAEETYPVKPIKVLTAYGPGSATDIIMRILGERMRESLGQPIVIENKPGAFGIIAIEEMARSKPDGYTLMIGQVSTNAITPVLFANKFSINYDQDVVPIARLADLPSFFLVTGHNFPPKTIAEFVAYAREHPGKIRYGSPGPGSFPHLDMEVLAKQSGLQLVHIPVKAGPPGYINDLANGDINAAMINVATVAGMVKSGQLRALAVNSEQRLADYPDVPTMVEAGYPELMTVLWAGLFAPAATPKPVLETLHKAIVQALNSQEVRSAYAKQLIRPNPTASLDEAKTWLAGEIAKWRRVTSEIKIEATD